MGVYAQCFINGGIPNHVISSVHETGIRLKLGRDRSHSRLPTLIINAGVFGCRAKTVDSIEGPKQAGGFLFGIIMRTVTARTVTLKHK
jgi:hypothetical protein